MSLMVKKQKKKSKSSRLLSYLKSSKGGVTIFAIVFAVVGGVLVYSSFASVDPYDLERQSKLVDDPARGVVYKGLKPIKKNIDHPCVGGFEVEGIDPKLGRPLCTHGPDPAPKGVNIKDPVRVKKQVDAAYRASFNSKVQNEKDLDQQNNSVAQLDPSQSLLDQIDLTDIEKSVKLTDKCVGDGTAGNRIVLIYAYTPDYNNGTYVKPIMRDLSRALQGVFYYNTLSSKQVLRFRHNANCEPLIYSVQLENSDINGDYNSEYARIVNRLISKGFNSNTRKYIVWVDANLALVDNCGVADFFDDSDYENSKNNNDIYGGYSIIGPGCWSLGTTLHEFMHNLGAVQPVAPNFGYGAHCLDEFDIVCYNTEESRLVCPTDIKTSLRPIIVYDLDCKDNDYWNDSCLKCLKYTGNLFGVSYTKSYWNSRNTSWLSATYSSK